MPNVTFTTQSGSRYILKDNKLTRLSEIPILDWNNIPLDQILNESEILEVNYAPVLGERFTCRTEHGPVLSTPVVEITYL